MVVVNSHAINAANAPALLTVTLPRITPGDAVYVTVESGSPGGGVQPTGVTDSAGNTYKLLRRVLGIAGDTVALYIFGITNALGGTNVVVTVAGTGSIDTIVHAVAFSNVALRTSPPLAIDRKASGGNGNLSPTTVSLTTAEADEIVYVVVTIDTGSTAVPTAPGLTFVRRIADVVAADFRMATFYAVAASPGTYSITETPSGQSSTAVVAFGVVGANTRTPFDPGVPTPVSAFGAGNAATVAITTDNPNDLIIGAVGDDGTLAPPPPAGTAGAGFTLIAEQSDDVNFLVDSSAEYDVVSVPQTSLAVGFTTDSRSGEWAIIADAIVAAPPTPLDPAGIIALALGTASPLTASLTPNQPADELLVLWGAVSISGGATFTAGGTGTVLDQQTTPDGNLSLGVMTQPAGSGVNSLSESYVPGTGSANGGAVAGIEGLTAASAAVFRTLIRPGDGSAVSSRKVAATG